MNRPRRNVLFAALVLLAVTLVLALSIVQPFEPRYGGMPASQYVRAVLATNQFAALDVTNKLMRMGPELAVPALIRVAGLEDSRWRRWYQLAYQRPPFSWRRYLPPPKSRMYLVNHAAFALGFFGADARPAVPTLERISERGQDFLRSTAIDALGRIGPAAKGAVPTLLKGVIATNQTHIRLATIQALPKIDLDGRLSVPTLAALLTDRDVHVASMTTMTLATMARWSPGLLSHLWTALRDPRVEVCSAAASGLKSHDALTRESIEPFLQELDSADAAARSRAARVLAYGGKFAPDVVPKLLHSARDREEKVRQASLQSLGALALDPTVVTRCRVDAALQVVHSGAENDAWRMMDLLPQLQPEASVLVPLLVNVLHHGSPRVRGKAAETLGKLGPAAREAVLELLVLTHDDWLNVREAATNALRRIQRPPR